MIWLISLVLILQGTFYWLIKPAILFVTPILELQGFGVIFLLILLWAFSGNDGRQLSERDQERLDETFSKF